MKKAAPGVALLLLILLLFTVGCGKKSTAEDKLDHELGEYSDVKDGKRLILIMRDALPGMTGEDYTREAEEFIQSAGVDQNDVVYISPTGGSIMVYASDEEVIRIAEYPYVSHIAGYSFHLEEPVD